MWKLLVPGLMLPHQDLSTCDLARCVTLVPPQLSSHGGRGPSYSPHLSHGYPVIPSLPNRSQSSLHRKSWMGRG